MYDFIKYQWILARYTTTNMGNCVTKGYITQDQADTILAMEQISTKE
jgi:hypothetical protein